MKDLAKVDRSLNATTHGLTAKTVLVPGEDATAWDVFEGMFVAELAPVGAVEGLLAHRVAAAAWRLLRVEQLEGSLASFKVDDVPEIVAARREGTKARGWKLPDPKRHHVYDALAKLARHEAAIERSMFRSFGALEELQAARRGREGKAKGPAGFR